jgi:hypothetical protein
MSWNVRQALTTKQLGFSSSPFSDLEVGDKEDTGRQPVRVGVGTGHRVQPFLGKVLVRQHRDAEPGSHSSRPPTSPPGWRSGNRSRRFRTARPRRQYEKFSRRRPTTADGWNNVGGRCNSEW